MIFIYIICGQCESWNIFHSSHLSPRSWAWTIFLQTLFPSVRMMLPWKIFREDWLCNLFSFFLQQWIHTKYFVITISNSKDDKANFRVGEFFQIQNFFFDLEISSKVKNSQTYIQLGLIWVQFEPKHTVKQKDIGFLKSSSDHNTNTPGQY